MSHPYDEECCCVECCYVRAEDRRRTLVEASTPQEHTRWDNLKDEIASLHAEIEHLKRGEFICQKCGLRKDDVHPTQSSF